MRSWLRVARADDDVPPPAGRLRRTAALALLGAALFTAVPPAVFARRAALTVELAADPPRRILSGIYPAERAPDGTTFVWTRETFALTLPGLDRRLPWRLALRIAAARPDGATPDLVTSVDGVIGSSVTLPAGGFTDHVVTIDPRTDAVRATAVSFRVVPPFVPGGDPRELGAQIDRLSLEPLGGWPRLRGEWLPAAAMGAAAGALAGLVAVPIAVALAWLVVTTALVGLLTTMGLAPYAGAAWWPAFGVAVGAAAIAAVLLPRERSGAAGAVLITFTAAAVHLLLLLHPDMPLGDALFHAHRFQDVLAGRYYFTSLAPGNYQFPYPIGLYLTAVPWARWTRSALENAALLRVIVVLANAGFAALLYRIVCRWRPHDEVAAASSVAAFHLLPLSFGVMATGNLTNAFAQSIAVAALAVAAALSTGAGTRGQRWRLGLLLCAVGAAAFLSHTSTFVVLAAQLLVAGVWLTAAGRASRPNPGVVILAASATAVALAVAVYYAHFGEVYREAWERITAETGRATAAAGGRTPFVRLVEAPEWMLLYYGAPMLILFVIGLFRAVVSARPIDRRLSAVLTAWLLVAIFFLALGIVTPVDLRHFYAALPAVAAIVGLAVSWLWRAGAWTAAGAVLVGGWALWVAWRESAVRFLTGS
jgi:hypothetical protein